MPPFLIRLLCCTRPPPPSPPPALPSPTPNMPTPPPSPPSSPAPAPAPESPNTHISPITSSNTPPSTPPSSPPPEATPRYASWSNMVRGLQNPQPLDPAGNVLAYAPFPLPSPAAPRRIIPSLAPSPFPTPFQLPPSIPVPFPRPIPRELPSHSPTMSVSTSDSHSDSSTVSHSQVTILHLPNEVLDLILRYLSSRPRAPEPLWDNVIDARNAMAFALTCTRARDLFRARLTSIRTRPERYREDLLYTPPTAGVVIDARTPTDVAHLAAVLRLAGGSLRELLITKSLPRTTWVESYIRSVVALRRLSLRDVNREYPLERILEQSRRTLRDLEIVGATGMALSERQLMAMGKYCGLLESLALRLSMFDHDWTNVWMGIGPGLQRLSLGATRFWIMDMEEDALLEQIGRYCVDLRHLHFYHLGPTLGGACARLCRRYGKQLKTLELEQSQLLRGDLEGIADGCQDTEVSISHGSSLFSHAYNGDVIDVLGAQIVTLRYRSQLAHDESLWEVGRQCKKLRELRLDCASTLTESALESILKGVAGNLERLSMSFFVRGLERALASTALVLLARYANELRELHIGGQKFDMDAFRETVRRCSRVLSKVSVTFGFRTAGEREVIETGTLVQVVQAVYGCDKLRSLVIVDRTTNESRSNNTELREACYRLRGRMNRISICGIDYVR